MLEALQAGQAHGLAGFASSSDRTRPSPGERVTGYRSISQPKSQLVEGIDASTDGSSGRPVRDFRLWSVAAARATMLRMVDTSERTVVVADLLPRAGAMLVDCAILGLYMPVDAYLRRRNPAWGVLGLTLGIAYFAWGNGVRGRTFGKELFGLEVVDAGGDAPVGWSRGVLRTAAALVLGLFLVDVLHLLWDSRRQALHDLAAGTLVVQNPSRLVRHADSPGLLRRVPVAVSTGDRFSCQQWATVALVLAGVGMLPILFLFGPIFGPPALLAAFWARRDSDGVPPAIARRVRRQTAVALWLAAADIAFGLLAWWMTSQPGFEM